MLRLTCELGPEGECTHFVPPIFELLVRSLIYRAVVPFCPSGCLQRVQQSAEVLRDPIQLILRTTCDTLHNFRSEYPTLDVLHSQFPYALFVNGSGIAYAVAVVVVSVAVIKAVKDAST